MSGPRPHLLPATPEVPQALIRRVGDDHDRFARDGLPADLDRYLRDAYDLDMTGSYAGIPVRNPWGKASGQLTLNLAQLEEAADLGLGFAVLKTVIAQDAAGHQSMSAWAIKESRMVAEPIVSPTTGDHGWTVTWRGRGWWHPFADYLTLVREGVRLGRARGIAVIPSVKYHLPGQGETEWRTDEYVETTKALLAAWTAGGGTLPMCLEKDFSPTLAGSDLAGQRPTVLDWLRRVPDLVRTAAPGQVRIGLKMFNTLDDDAFQLAMLAEVHGRGRPDFLIYANRLFDSHKVFDGVSGVAYGGPDLSDRNLRLLTRLRAAQERGEIAREPLEISATGDICSGRMAVEYALRGSTSYQIHTMFQLPSEAYSLRTGPKVSRAIHRLYFDPVNGFIVWAAHAARRLGTVATDGSIRFLDLARRGAESCLSARDLNTQTP
jgi:hypothetical protein